MTASPDRPATSPSLQDPDAGYRAFFDQVPIGLYRTTPQGRILDANQALVQLLGYPSREALLAVNATDIYVDPEDRRAQQRLMESEGVIRHYHMRLRRLDGTVIWVEDNTHAVRDPDGRVVYHEGSLQDITERKLAQERLSKLSQCFLDFGSDPLANINRLTALCGELLGADCALYSQLQDGLLCTCAQWHTPLDYNPVCDPAGHICTEIIRRASEETVLFRDLPASAYAETDPNVSRFGLRTCVGQAVMASDGSVGSLCAVFRRDFIPTQDDRSLMKTIAIAIGIEEKRRLAEETNARQARQMAALYETSLEIGAQRDMAVLLPAIVQRAATMVGATMGGLYLVQQDGETLALAVNYNLPEGYALGTKLRLGEGVSGRVAQTGAPLMVEDHREWAGRAEVFADSPLRRVLAVPLRLGDRVLGVLNITDAHRAGAFSDDEVRLITLFADQAAIALENARLYQAAQHELAQLASAETALRQSEERYRRLFEDSPVSLWEEDFSALKTYLDKLRCEGVEDLAAYFAAHPDEVAACTRMITIVDVNRATLELYHAHTKEELCGNLDRILPPEATDRFASELLALAHGNTLYEAESINRKLDGEVIDVALRIGIAPGHEQTWSKVIVSVVDITQQKRAEDDLRYLSTHDALTGLRNRTFFEEEIARLACSRQYPISVLMADVDGLKTVNDQQGHAAGDALLRDAGEVLKGAFRSEDVVARIGGDEFGVLLPSTDAQTAEQALKRVEDGLEAHNRSREGTPLSFSMGVATAEPGTSLTAALALADGRMYANKNRHHASRDLTQQ